jgi:hypothetical protein
MKQFIIYSFASLILVSCGSSDNKTPLNIKPDNYVVVLDLSDRIIQNQDQVNIDISAISSIFAQFENSIKKNLVVKSKDKFSVRIIPQAMSSLPANSFENNLSIDMDKFNAAEKNKYLTQFKIDFPKQLTLLYQQAILGNKNSDYAGVDIWQYFNEQINSDLEPNYNNKVLIITDGYFDFEDKKHGLSNQKMSTTTSPLLKQMIIPNWKEVAERDKIGLIPVKLTIEATWQVCGIQPKASNKDLLEVEKLCYLWKKWLGASGAKKINNPIINGSSNKIKNLISNSF